MLRLSDLVGSDVRSAEGEVMGHLVDMTIEIGDDRPVVRRIGVGRRRHIRFLLDWDAVVAFEHDDIQLSTARADMTTRSSGAELRDREVLLARDVLDTQVIDIGGKRLARVADVVLVRSGTSVEVAGVEVGAAGVWRRLGLDRISERAAEQVVNWADLHLTSTRGHTLQLGTPSASVHRLPGPELAAVVARLPTTRAAEVLDAVSPTVAASALSASHPGVGARLLHAVSRRTASSLVDLMRVDDATSVLRGMSAEAVDALLGTVTSDRASTLRRLLTHPADTAGGLMNTEIRTASVGETVGQIRDRVAADMPELEGLATVFVVDDERRPVGSFEPTDLLAGRPTPRRVPTVPASLPVDKVIDLFALQDYLALPVVDDEGRLVGVVAIDDVLEELLAERLPGQRRYGRVRRGWRRHSRRRRDQHSTVGS